MAEFLGGIADSNSTVCHGPTAMGIQEAGRVGATAGQSKSRADLTVYWGSNPLESMPRHMSRYAVYPRGYWTEAREVLIGPSITVDRERASLPRTRICIFSSSPIPIRAALSSAQPVARQEAAPFRRRGHRHLHRRDGGDAFHDEELQVRGHLCGSRNRLLLWQAPQCRTRF